MKRPSRAPSARDDADNRSAVDTSGAEAESGQETMAQVSAANSNADGPVAAAAGGNEGGGPGSARVTRERALYFATGQRASPTTATSSGLNARRVSTATQSGGEQKESWPGYFSTARDLDDNRLAAQAARQEELQRKEQEDAKLAETKVMWTPRKKPRTTVLTQDNLVASLQELALQCLAKHIDLLPTLEYIDATARAQVANAVVKLRRMKSEGEVSLFAACYYPYRDLEGVPQVTSHAQRMGPTNMHMSMSSAAAVHLPGRDGDRHPGLLEYRRGLVSANAQGVSRPRWSLAHDASPGLVRPLHCR